MIRPGDLVLLRLPSGIGSNPKLRPALVLSLLPGVYQNVLICGISTQQQLHPDWDELVDSHDPDYALSGLRHTSAIRLSYLYAADLAEIAGTIGRIGNDRLNRLLARLSAHIVNQQPT